MCQIMKTTVFIYFTSLFGWLFVFSLISNLEDFQLRILQPNLLKI